MKILGLSSWFHDSSACLLIDGEVVAYAEEERFNREKHTPKYPQAAVDWILEDAEFGLDDLDEVVFYMHPWHYLRMGVKTALASLPASLSLIRSDAATRPPLYRLKRMFGLKRELCRRHGAKGEFDVVTVRHYRTHQGSTFYASGFEDSAVLTLDFAGDGIAEVIAHGRGLDIDDKLIHTIPHAFALVYTTVTHILGFRWDDEYKVMGMAAYGSPRFREEIDRLYTFDLESGAFRLDLDYFNFHKYGRYNLYSPKAVEIFGPPPDPGSPPTQREYDLAASLQAATTDYGLAMARFAKDLTRSANLCLAGGVAQNCLMNQAICDSGLFENVFLQPLAGDIGCTLGAALYRYHQVHRRRRRYVMRHLFLGPSYCRESDTAAARCGLKACPSEDWHGDVARAIADGMVVGYFDGRMEVGPRALGSRSIMADPGRRDMKDILNSRVKHREHFRPFAPSVLAEEVDTVFEPLPACRSLDYMIVTMNVKPEWKDKVPAIIHDDGTARVQAVHEAHAPNYYRIIRRFFEMTGVPLVVNTSFNDNEPIVCTPEHAINCFVRTQIDLLVLDGKLYYRDDNRHAVSEKTEAL